MIRNTEWCPECRARAEGFLVPASQDARCMKSWDKDHRDGFVLARETDADLARAWKQQPTNGTRSVVWRPEHRLRVDTYTADGYGGRPYMVHLAVSNRDSSRSRDARLCQIPDDIIKLIGPGAEDHIATDAPAVAAQLAKEDLELRHKVRLVAESAEAKAFGSQLVAVLKTLGIECSVTGEFHFPGDDAITKPQHYSIDMQLPVAARVAEALGGTVARPPRQPMPLWRVWYGKSKDEDKEPAYVAARTEAGVIAHMTAHYCHERTPDDEPNIPLRPELLIIEPAGPDPEVPAEEEDAA
jgi:hypothetical protein